jgi:hypothetical protein
VPLGKPYQPRLEKRARHYKHAMQALLRSSGYTHNFLLRYGNLGNLGGAIGGRGMMPARLS